MSRFTNEKKSEQNSSKCGRMEENRTEQDGFAYIESLTLSEKQELLNMWRERNSQNG